MFPPLDAAPGGRVLLIDKPLATGSTDVVREVRHAFRTERVGHTGTLDPDATGLLVLCVGEATKLVPYLTAEDKTYVGTITFGASTDSDDASGRVLEEAPVPPFTAETLRAALDAWVGRHPQRPPRVSAIRVAGRRLHERVRAGEDVDALLVPREVDLYAADVLEVGPRYACVRLHVGKGFYVRSLARDLGPALGTLAHLSGLRRERVGGRGGLPGFSVNDAAPLDQLGRDGAERFPTLSAVEALRRVMPVHVATPEHVRRIRAGQRIGAHELPETLPQDQPLAVLDPSGALVAVAEFKRVPVAGSESGSNGHATTRTHGAEALAAPGANMNSPERESAEATAPGVLAAPGANMNFRSGRLEILRGF